MKLAMAQMAMTNDMEANFAKSYDFAQQAKGADLLFYPEIQQAPFLPQYHVAEVRAHFGKTAEDYLLAPGDAHLQKFQELAKEEQLAISPNVYLNLQDGNYDTSLFINKQGEVQGTSKMVHILSAPQFWEKEYYTPAPDGFKVYTTDFGKIGIVICFDRHLPESIRTCALKGAELVIVPTANLTSEPMELFEQEIRVQAYQNGVFVAMCNRVGKEGEVTFAGESLVVDPNGQTICKADGREQLVTCDLDLAAVYQVQQMRPYLALRRPDMYA